jgi:membrane-bound ClpP family serine protease
VSSYPTKSFRRTALAPGILGAIVLLAGLALLESSGFYWIKVVVAILAAIMVVFAWQARQWWWVPILGAIVVLWNPIWPIDLHQEYIWVILQYVAVIAFVVAGILIRVPNEDDRNKRTAQNQRKR